MDASLSNPSAGFAIDLQSVFHPTDFSDASERAFAHALKIALRRQARFTILHVDPLAPAELDWRSFPAVRTTLKGWGLLPEGSPHEAVLPELGISVEKVALRGWSTVPAILGYLADDRVETTDLIVLATNGRGSLPRQLHRSVAERLARRSSAMTLFVPSAARGFVSSSEGSVNLKNILVPVASDPRPHSAIWAAVSMVRAVAEEVVEVTLFHVGERAAMPAFELPSDFSVSWDQSVGCGQIVAAILRAAAERSADLIVMATRGHDGFLDALRGSSTEQVIRRAPCPVLAVPERDPFVFRFFSGGSLGSSRS